MNLAYHILSIATILPKPALSHSFANEIVKFFYYSQLIFLVKNIDMASKLYRYACLIFYALASTVI